MMGGKNKQSGFTIVELLIVVVVIAILAAITIVAYNGIQDRSKTSATLAKVTQLNKKLLLYSQTNNNQYPSDASTLPTDIGYTLGPDDKYIVNNTISPAQYCLSIAPNGTSSSYAMTSTTSSPLKGVCVMNYSLNPSFETSITQPSNSHYGSSSTQVTGTGVTSGSSAVKLHSTLSSNGEAMRFIQGNFTVLNGLTPGAQYTFSIDMASLGAFANNTGSQRRIAFRWQTTVGGTTYSSQLPNGASSGRLFVTGSSPSNATGIMFQIEHWGTSSDPDIIVDSAMITEGSTHYAYGDGSSPGWWWTGTPQLSTSVGPAEVVQ